MIPCMALLRASFSALALQPTLQASPCNGYEPLLQIDKLLRAALCKIRNVSLSDDQRLLVSLPVKSGGLGLCRVASLAPSAFIALAVGSRDLLNYILQNFAQMPDKVVAFCQQA